MLLRDEEPVPVDCPVAATSQDADLPELVARSELVPPGSVGRERGPTVEAFEGLADPFGPVLAGRFFKPRDPAPALLPLGERLGLVGRTSLRVIDLPSGALVWSTSLDAPIARGGLVGQDVSLLTSGPTPSVLTLAGSTGELVACVEVPAVGNLDRAAARDAPDRPGRSRRRRGGRARRLARDRGAAPGAARCVGGVDVLAP